MHSRSKCRVIIYLIVLITIVATQIAIPHAFAAVVMNFGDQNIEQWSSIIGANMVQAYTMFTVPGPAIIQSVSMYMQYSGSDGTQCLKFGIYLDNGNGSPAGQPLVSATLNSYCLHGSASWGPAWETFRLRPNDTLGIPSAGAYWIAILAPYSYGSVHHYAYTSSYDFTYGYASCFFYSPYANGFPISFSTQPAWEGNGPYSIYVTALAA